MEEIHENKAALVRLRGLEVSFSLGRASWFTAVDRIDLDIGQGEAVGLVGESGCGKTVTALALMGLLPEVACRAGADLAEFDGAPFSIKPGYGPNGLARGRDVSMVFQDALAALDPVFTIGAQLVEAIRVYAECTKEEARERAVTALDHVGIPDSESRMRAYPHQLSGGMRQRVMIAMALLHRPRLLIADEPTTALDVTIQAQVLSLVDRLRREGSMSILFITHDLGIVGQLTDRVVVMYAGRVAESGPSERVLTRPLHPYTAGLLASMPGMHRQGGRLAAIPGRVPSPVEFPGMTGCRFAPRCPLADERCRLEVPVLADRDGVEVACHHAGRAADA
ncbi:MAG TPA: ABC transporter ATP-binding protein [Spirochaetota bacterium]|nr:ABC transporter ATP-binding protein [Spirochaetota bacterium]